MADRANAVIRHRAAVTGSPVSHSLSPALHRAAYAGLGLGDWSYERRETAPADLPVLLTEMAAPVQTGPVWAGLSVTMPHKQALLAHLDVVDPLAEAVGAVNTVVAQRSGAGGALLTGFNTDVAGIVGALRETAHRTLGDSLQKHLPIERAVVLGSGARSLALEFDAPRLIRRLVYTPSQHRDVQGHIQRYELYLDGEKVAEGEFANIRNNPIPVAITLPEAKEGKTLRLVVTKTVEDAKDVLLGDLAVD